MGKTDDHTAGFVLLCVFLVLTFILGSLWLAFIRCIEICRKMFRIPDEPDEPESISSKIGRVVFVILTLPCQLIGLLVRCLRKHCNRESNYGELTSTEEPV